MAVIELNKTTNEIGELIKLAKNRVTVPNDYIFVQYQKDVDLLFIKLTDAKSTYSDDDMDKGVIYNYDQNDKLVSMEILDLYGIFAEA